MNFIQDEVESSSDADVDVGIDGDEENRVNGFK